MPVAVDGAAALVRATAREPDAAGTPTGAARGWGAPGWGATGRKRGSAGTAVMDSRYLIVFGACLTQFTVIGLLFSFGIFFSVLEAEFGWSRTLLSSATALAALVMGLLAVSAGRLCDRYGPAPVLAGAGLLFGAGFSLISMVDEPWQLFALFALFIGVGMSTHDVATLSTIARWFVRRRGIMTGVAKVGTATGQMTLPPLTAFLIAVLGWRGAALALGIAAAALLLVAAASMKRPPPDRAAAPTSGPERGGGFAEIRRSRTFWTLCAAQFLFFPTLMTVPLHIAVHGMDLGMTRGLAAALLTVIGASSIAGRLTVGTFADRIGGRNAYVLCLVPLVTSLLVLMAVDTHGPLFAVVALYGFGHGGLFTVVSPTVAEYFGTRTHGAIYGGIYFFGTIGGAAGPIMAGWVFDVTGSYEYAFATLSLMGAGALVLMASLPPPRSERLLPSVAGRRSA